MSLLGQRKVEDFKALEIRTNRRANYTSRSIGCLCADANEKGFESRVVYHSNFRDRFFKPLKESLK